MFWSELRYPILFLLLILPIILFATVWVRELWMRPRRPVASAASVVSQREAERSKPFRKAS